MAWSDRADYSGSAKHFEHLVPISQSVTSFRVIPNLRCAPSVWVGGTAYWTHS